MPKHTRDARMQEFSRLHECMHAFLPVSRGWQKRHNGACVLSDREEEKRVDARGGGQGDPSSWVIFNQQ